MKITVTMIATNLIINSLLSLSCFCVEKKNNQIFNKLGFFWYFVVITSRVLLQSHAKFNRLF